MYWNNWVCQWYAAQTRINRNMRCIEIDVLKGHKAYQVWLIETWDVLKCAAAERRKGG